MAEPFAVVVKEPTDNFVVVDEIDGAVAIVNIGNEGKEGKEGKAGKSGDLHFVFTQGSASQEWIIEHELGKFPSVSAEDTAGEDIQGAVEYINENKLVIYYSAATGGVAYLN